MVCLAPPEPRRCLWVAWVELVKLVSSVKPLLDLLVGSGQPVIWLPDWTRLSLWACPRVHSAVAGRG